MRLQPKGSAGFPQGACVERVEVLDPATLRMRVWERGAGETQACGSGACAAFVAARSTGRVSVDEAAVQLPGGDPFSGRIDHRAIVCDLVIED